MKVLYCRECSEYLMGGDGECHDCVCGWKQPVEVEDFQVHSDVVAERDQLVREMVRLSMALGLAPDKTRGIDAVMEAIDGLLNRVVQGSEDKRDADRYRWLKECNGGGIGIVAWHRDEEKEMVLTEGYADDAIDAARTGSNG